jgi:hypothetical protein
MKIASRQEYVVSEEWNPARTYELGENVDSVVKHMPT